jgi:hypothetical protein
MMTDIAASYVALFLLVREKSLNIMLNAISIATLVTYVLPRSTVIPT